MINLKIDPEFQSQIPPLTCLLYTSQKAYPVVCGEKKALLRKCNNPL